MDDAQLIPLDTSSDLVVTSDALEHIQDEAQALREWMRVLRPGGQLVIFVPSFQFLWGKRDKLNHHYHHYRRYTAEQLAAALQRAGLVVQRRSYWNVSLFFPAAAVRLFNRLLPTTPKQLKMIFLLLLFSLTRYWAT